MRGRGSVGWCVALGVLLLGAGDTIALRGQRSARAAEQAAPVALQGQRQAQRLPARALGAVRVLAGTGVRSMVYVASSRGLYSAAAPFVLWERRTPLATIAALSINAGAPAHLVYATDDGTLYRSTDGGHSALAVAHTLSGVRLVRAEDRPATLYAFANADSVGMILRSTDDGRTWSTVLSPGGIDPCQPCAVNALGVDGTVSTHLLAGVSYAHGGALLESRDGGARWRTVAALAGAAPDLVALDHVHATDLWVSWRGGSAGPRLLHSRTGGRSWSEWDGDLQPTDMVTAITYTARGDAVVVAITTQADPAAGAAGARTGSTLYLSRDGTHFTPLCEGAPAPGSAVVIAASDHYLMTGDLQSALRVTAMPSCTT